jgi:hypothetical protein
MQHVNTVLRPPSPHAHTSPIPPPPTPPQVDVAYTEIKEIRTAPRAFGLWGDMVIFLKDGERLEVPGLEQYMDVKRYIESKIPSNVM